MSEDSLQVIAGRGKVIRGAVAHVEVMMQEGNGGCGEEVRRKKALFPVKYDLLLEINSKIIKTMMGVCVG